MLRGGIGEVIGLDGNQTRFHKLLSWPGSRETVGNVALFGKEILNRDGETPARSVAGIFVLVPIVGITTPATTMNAGFQELRSSRNVNELTSVKISS